MSIWNNSAGPIGYAYNSSRGSGINIKPIDPRAFLVDTGSTTRSSGGSSDSDVKYNAQMGTRSQLEYVDAMLESQKTVLQNTYRDKIYAEKDEQKVLQLQKEYVNEVNNLTQQKMRINVLKQSAEFSDLQQKKVDNIILDRKLNKDIALEESLANVSTGEGIVNMFRLRRAPVSYDVRRRRLMTYEDRQDYVNRASGVYTDENGVIQISDYKAPVLKINNSEDADKEVRSIVAGADGNYTRNTSFMGPTGGSSSDYSDNQGSLNEVVGKIWNAISEDTKNYAFSAVLGIGIIYETGNTVPVLKNGKQEYDKKGKPLYEKELDTISGEEAIERISILIAEADKLDKDDPEKLKKINEANRIGNGILNTAKGYVRDMAAGDATGLRRVVRNYSSTVKEPENNSDLLSSKEANEFIALLESSLPSANALWINKTGAAKWTRLVDNQGKPITKYFNVDESVAKYTTNKLFGLTPIELKKIDVTMSDMQDFFIANGEYIHKDKFGAENQKQMRFKKLGGQGYLLPKFYNPQNGDLTSTEIYQTRNEQPVMTPYVEMVFEVPGSFQLEVIEGGKKVMKRVSEIERKKVSTGYDIKSNGEKYEITLLKEVNPYEGTNKQSMGNYISNQKINIEAGVFREYHQQANQERIRKELEIIRRDTGVEHIGFYYGKPIPKDPKQAFKQISAGLVGSRNYQINVLQAINDLLESVDPNERASFREGLMKEYQYIKTGAGFDWTGTGM